MTSIGKYLSNLSDSSGGVRNGFGVVLGWVDAAPGPKPARQRLLGVELDDELLAHGHVDLLADRQVEDRDGVAVLAGLEPCRRGAVYHVAVPLDGDHLPGLVADGDDVALAHP